MRACIVSRERIAFTLIQNNIYIWNGYGWMGRPTTDTHDVIWHSTSPWDMGIFMHVVSFVIALPLPVRNKYRNAPWCVASIWFLSATSQDGKLAHCMLAVWLWEKWAVGRLQPTQTSIDIEFAHQMPYRVCETDITYRCIKVVTRAKIWCIRCPVEAYDMKRYVWPRYYYINMACERGGIEQLDFEREKYTSQRHKHVEMSYW